MAAPAPAAGGQFVRSVSQYPEDALAPARPGPGARGGGALAASPQPAPPGSAAPPAAAGKTGGAPTSVQIGVDTDGDGIDDATINVNVADPAGGPGKTKSIDFTPLLTRVFDPPPMAQHIISPYHEMGLYDLAGHDALDQKFENVINLIKRQQHVVDRLFLVQKQIEERQAHSHNTDRYEVQDEFAQVETQLEDHQLAIRAMVQQQDHIIRLLEVSKQADKQEEQIDAFEQYQRDLAVAIELPFERQQKAAEVLHEYLPTFFANKEKQLKEEEERQRLVAEEQAARELSTNPSQMSEAELILKYTNTRQLVGGIPPHDNFDAEKDAKGLRLAMKGWGTNEKLLVRYIGSRNNEQRQHTAQAYNRLFKRDLKRDVKSETSGDFQLLLKSLLVPRDDYAAKLCHGAVKGLGTDEACLTDVICTATQDEMAAIKAAYQRLFEKSLESAVKSDTSGNYRALLVALIQANRDQSNTVDMNLVREDCHTLYQAGEGQFGTNEKQWTQILALRNESQLRATFDHYIKLHDKGFEKAIGSETSGDFKRALLTLVGSIQDRQALFAAILHTCMEGIGTNDKRLIRTLVSRSEVDLYDVEDVYYQKHKVTLVKRIRKDTGGDYRRLLVELFGDGDFDPQRDAKKLRGAMRGFGRSKTGINKVVGRRTNAQRQQVKDAYAQMYKRDLLSDFKTELSGSHRDLVLALMELPDQLLASEVKRAVKGLGTDDRSLIELLCSRTGFQMKQLKALYEARYKKALVADVKSDTSGWYRKLLASLIERERDDNEPVNVEAARAEAKRFLDAGEGRMGTDEKVFIDILCTHSFRQLEAIFEEYSKICKYDIGKSIKRETSFNFKRALLAIVEVVRDPLGYYATRLHDCMKGLGTQDRNLIRIVVMHSEDDLADISAAFFEKYNKGLDSMVSGDTSKEYRTLLLRILDRSSHFRSARKRDADVRHVAAAGLNVPQPAVAAMTSGAGADKARAGVAPRSAGANVSDITYASLDVGAASTSAPRGKPVESTIYSAVKTTPMAKA